MSVDKAISAIRRPLISHKATDNYSYGLDLVRFVAALMVAAFHYTWRSPETFRMMPIGWLGVQVFFVISGYVIVASAQGRSPSGFAKGRFYRLYPTAWCALPISLVAISLPPEGAYRDLGIAVLSTPDAIFSSVVLLGRAFVGSAYWTLPIELAFYCLIFLLIWFRRLGFLPWTGIGLVVWSVPYLGALSLRAAGWRHIPNLDFGYGPGNMLLFRHGPYFALGIFLWMMKERKATALIRSFAGLALVFCYLEIYCRVVEVLPRIGHPVSGPGSVAGDALSGTGLTLIGCATFRHCYLLYIILLYTMIHSPPTLRFEARPGSWAC